MKKISFTLVLLFLIGCNTAPVEPVQKMAGYMVAGEDRYDLSLGDNSAVEIWDKYLDAHNAKDIEAIKAMEHEELKIWGPDGTYIEGKDDHAAFLQQWFDNNNPKWDTYFSFPLKVNWENQPGTWVTSGHTLTLTVDGNEVSTNDIADVYIEDGLIKMFYVFSRQLPPSPENTSE